MTRRPITFSFPAVVLTGVLTGALAVSLDGCSDKKAEAAKPPAAQSAAPADPMVFAVRPEIGQRLKLAAAGEADISERLDIPARLEVDAGRVEQIGSAVTGRVASISANVGDPVRAGQALAQISSAELPQAQLAYLRAYSAMRLAQQAAERARMLLAADVIGRVELQKRESEAAVTQAETNAAADQLRLLGLSDAAIARLRERGAIDSTSGVAASSRGVVIERKVSKGQVVQPADKLFVVADLSTLWISGWVPEQAARMIVLGQSVSAHVPALEHTEDLPGKVIFISDTVDPATRSVQIRTSVDNAARKLKPEMLATLLVSLKPKKMLAMPSAAVVREGDKDYVFVSLDANRFRMTEVNLGAEVDELRPVYAGLKPGARIVADGAFHLNNERKRAELE
ncbi:MAG: efflux RND transporter periplasmic adaptor subunit [Candidatus Protistobacter heckmanni]|nr:efflux RND transporter periplasmic adaptor subunit [Candidatus Protistobacter heckmanni]